ncbi:MAG TPA: DUF2235 domain-containing protein [Thermoanaerobaculia bacterium]|jgi:uncharacterized protein (DUF2235 family)|nr:DUF2235 domain-containing protein [Thermoanaerobaculia bacterium]
MPDPRRLVLCLDGTWNSTYTWGKRSNAPGVLKPSNVLKLCRAVEPRSADGREQIAYYDIGVGALAKYPGTANRLLHLADKVLGGGWAAGFEANIEDALHFLTLNHQPGDEVFIFGFSRGAATARALTRFLAWAGGLPRKSDAYYLPLLFRAYIDSKGTRPCAEVLGGINDLRKSQKRPPLEPFQTINVEYLGVWDTVMALGARFKATGAGTSTASKTFHLDSQPAPCVKHARQALAIDEMRYDFRPEIWTGHEPHQVLEQRWFAGVHSNVGGGYVNDGLANVAFRWILRGAETHGLKMDDRFVGHYRGFPQDRLYRSENIVYRALDALRWRFGRGKRKLADPQRPAGANLSLSPSVIHRIAADPEKFQETMDGKPYRPENVLLFLASQPDLNQYLAQIEPDPVKRQLPAEVLARIDQLRKGLAKQVGTGMQGGMPQAPLP